jgi:hypothetical protein
VLRVLTLTAGLTLMATLVLASPATALAPRLVHGADAVFVAAEAVIVCARAAWVAAALVGRY